MKYAFGILNFLFLLPLHLFSHGGHEAFYTLEEKGGNWILVVKVEAHDLERELKKYQISADNLSVGLGKYLKNRFSMKVDGQLLERKFESSYTSKGYLYCTYDLGSENKDPKKLEVKNTCFKGYDHNYHNFVIIRIAGQEVRYKMTDIRSSIQHNF